MQVTNLRDEVLELIETHSINPADYETVWEMYDNVNFDTHIDMLIDDHLYQTRDALVKWVCDGNFKYLDRACSEEVYDDPIWIMQQAQILYLSEVAFDTVFVVYAYSKE